MAFSPKSLLFLSILFFFIFTSQAYSVGNNGNGHAKGSFLKILTNNRKLTPGLRRGLHVDGELRRVPSGPDPLHHNGGSPKKPKITP